MWILGHCVCICLGMSKQQKSRAFELELYPDTESYDCYAVLKWIRDHYDYVFCYHDKDVFEEDAEAHKKGDLKKAHYHVIIRWSGCPRYAGGLSKEMGVESRFFLALDGGDNSKKSLKYRLRYLIHMDEYEKYQYPVSDVKGSGRLKRLFLQYVGACNNLSVDEKMRQIMKYIKNERYVSTFAFIEFCLDYDLLDFYHKYGREINRLLDEHNYHYSYVSYDST